MSQQQRSVGFMHIFRVLRFCLLLAISYGTAYAIPNDEDHTQRFVDNKRCLSCHAEQAEQWQGSHHQQAMQVADPKTVLGDFDNRLFSDAGVTSRFFQKNGKYFVNTPGEDGEAADFEVKYTFGVEPLQQYLLALPKGRLQAFTVAWDTEKEQWFDLYPDEKFKLSDDLHWTRRSFTANSSCIDCHTTNMKLGFDVEKQSYQTQWNEINVSCQSCHGPGADHVDWAENLDGTQKPTPGQGSENDKGLVVNYRQMNNKGFVETCAQCHSRRVPLSQDHVHGRNLMDDFLPELLQEGLYHADGQILDEVFVYGSFVQSKMYKSGVSCNDCHNPHSLKLRKPGNAVCTQCHQAEPPKQDFQTLKAAVYDSKEHHFHPPNSEGAACVNCHMPATTYMQVDPRRDHSFRIPRPDLSKKWGTPNACTACHTDQSADWAIEAMNRWYGEKWQQGPSLAGLMTQARQGRQNTHDPLLDVILDPEQAAIIRATALQLVPPDTDNPRYEQIRNDTLTDASPLLRFTALQTLEQTASPDHQQQIKTKLNDPVKLVRMEAARQLAAVSRNQLSKAERTQLDKALEEYKSAQLAMADHPEGHFNLGNLQLRMSEPDAAEKSYQTAIEMDPYFMPSYNSLGQLLYATGRKRAALSTFNRALQYQPDSGDAHFSLALLQAENGETDKALEHFRRASELLPERLQVQYNYGVLLLRNKQLPEAERVLLKAQQLEPDNLRVIQALVALYRRSGQQDKVQLLLQQVKRLGGME